MARATTLTNPISGSNITDRLNSILLTSVNNGINYGTDNKPFSEVPNSYFGGTTSGISDFGSALTSQSVIDANGLIEAMENLTASCTNVRSANFTLRLTSSGSAPWNVSAGPRVGSPGIIENATGKSHLATNRRQTISISGGPASEDTITRDSVQTQVLTACRDAYLVAASNNVIMPTVNVCHASCHNSCHNSRTRR